MNGPKSLGLVESGLGVSFTGSGRAIYIIPTLSALGLYVRYQDSLLAPKDFFNITDDDEQANSWSSRAVANMTFSLGDRSGTDTISRNRHCAFGRHAACAGAPEILPASEATCNPVFTNEMRSGTEPGMISNL